MEGSPANKLTGTMPVSQDTPDPRAMRIAGSVDRAASVAAVQLWTGAGPGVVRGTHRVGGEKADLEERCSVPRGGARPVGGTDWERERGMTPRMEQCHG